MHLLVDPVTVQTDNNLISWNSVIKLSMQVVDVVGQFTVGSCIPSCKAAPKLPHTIFRLVVMYTIHSSNNLVSRTVEINGLSILIDILRCGLAI